MVTGTLTSGFQKTASPAVFDYAAAVAETHHAYPDRVADIVFYDAESDAVVHPDAGKAINETKRILNMTTFMQSVESYKRGHGANFCQNRSFSNPEKIISIEKGATVGFIPQNPEQEKYFTFDHELGHALLHNHASRMEQECLADTYASIRHFQRFGLDSTSLDQVILKRASQFVMSTHDGREAYYTHPMIERVIEQKEALDIMNLSPAGTAALAIHLVGKYQPATPYEAALTFNKMHEEVAATYGLGTYEALAKLALTTRSRPVFKPAFIVLQDVFDAPGFAGKETWEGYKNLAGQRMAYFKETGDLKQPFLPVVAPARGAMSP